MNSRNRFIELDRPAARHIRYKFLIRFLIFAGLSVILGFFGIWWGVSALILALLTMLVIDLTISIDTYRQDYMDMWPVSAGFIIGSVVGLVFADKNLSHDLWFVVWPIFGAVGYLAQTLIRYLAALLRLPARIPPPVSSSPAATMSASPLPVLPESERSTAFDAVVERVVAQDRQAARQELARQEARRAGIAPVADELSALFYDLAAHLSRSIAPRPIQLDVNRPFGPHYYSPAGYIVECHLPTLGSDGHTATILTADGRIWTYWLRSPYGDDLRVVGYVDLRDQFDRFSSYALLDFTFSVSNESGGLAASIGGDPSNPVEPSEAVARLAITIKGRNS